MVVESVRSSGVTIRRVVGELDARPGGTVAGPVMMDLADVVAWLSILAQVGPVLLAVTTSLHIDFLRKPVLEDLLGRGNVVKLGRTLAVVTVELTSVSAPDTLVALAQVTYALPRT
jgi:uncharacterized protein (TIGR00369 family)